MDDQRKTIRIFKRKPKRNRPQQILTHYMPIRVRKTRKAQITEVIYSSLRSCGLFLQQQKG